MLRKVAVAAFCLVFFAGVIYGGEWDKKTVLTVREPILVPGATLEPGTYVLRLVDVASSRHVVQFLNEKEDKVLAAAIALPNWRLKLKDGTEFAWWETPRGNPPAIRAWFYPGDNFGQEFVYPKGLAVKIARETGEKVLTTPAETEAELVEAPVAEVTKEAVEEPLEEAYVAPAPEPVAIAEAPVAAPEPIPEPEPLPATASPFYTIGLAGALAAAAGLALRLKYARSS